MSFDLSAAQKQLDKKLTQLRKKSYISTELIDLLDEVAHMQLIARSEASVVMPAADSIASEEDVVRGVPLVGREDFPFDAAQAEELLGKLISLLKKMDGPLSDAAKAVDDEIQAGNLTPAQLFERFLDDDAKFFGTWAERMPEAPKTVSFLAFASLIPSIECAAEQLAPKLPNMKVPAVSTCPLCGGLPLISSLKEKEGFRHATCSFCRHEYRVKRLGCTVCGEEDPEKISFFTVDEEPGFRVDVCDSCKTYLKTIDFRDLDRIAIPVLDDLDSLALDYVAAGQGYRRATLSAWGF